MLYASIYIPTKRKGGFCKLQLISPRKAPPVSQSCSFRTANLQPELGQEKSEPTRFWTISGCGELSVVRKFGYLDYLTT